MCICSDEHAIIEAPTTTTGEQHQASGIILLTVPQQLYCQS